MHRKIYIENYGPIPKELNGRSYDIHHIDNNHANNNPLNLKAVTIGEHYNIHYQQEDWGACFMIAKRLKKSPKEISELSRKYAFKRLNEGTHHFLNKENAKQRAIKKMQEGTHPFFLNNFQKKNNLKRMQEGTHHFIGLSKKRVKNGTHNWLKENGGSKRATDQQLLRSKKGTHHFLGGEIQRKANLELISLGEHSSQKEFLCPTCGKKGKGIGMFRWHFDKCKNK